MSGGIFCLHRVSLSKLSRLFDRDRLGQVARLIDVGAFEIGDVIGKSCSGDGQNRRKSGCAAGTSTT